MALSPKGLLLIEFRDLVTQWHPTKNGAVAPDQVVAGSGKKYWWKCPEGWDHEWEATVYNRTGGGRGCPYCSGLKVSVTNSLACLHPDIAGQWHPTKNGAVTPDQVVAGSHKKYWWQCPEGSDHDWEATVNNRTGGGTGCSFCSGLKVSVTNSLATLHPDIAAQWHPTRNGAVTPDQVVAGSNEKYWWQCPEGWDHEWEARVESRTNQGTGCPFCSGRKLSVTNSLAALHPDIAAQWHPTQNGAVTANQVVAGSHNKCWWRCSEGRYHEWEAMVISRTGGGRGCPYCSGLKASVTNSLATLHPGIAAQWHPTKNGAVTPEQVVAGSGKKYWWKCPEGPSHEWEAMVYKRTGGGQGCPCCSGPRYLRQASPN